MLQELIQKLTAELSKNDFLSGGLILGFLTSIVMYFRSVPAFLYERVIRLIRYEVSVEPISDLFTYVQKWLMDTKASKLRTVDAAFRRVQNIEPSNESIAASSSDDQRRYYEENTIVYHYKGDYFNFWYKGRFIRISHAVEKLENANSIQSAFFGRFHIKGLFAKRQINQLLEEIKDYNIQQERARIKPAINNHDINGYWEQSKRSSFKNLNHIFIPNDRKEELVTDLQSFASARDFYEKRGIAYRRGYCLHGPPGTGKSSLVSACTIMLKRDLYILNLKVFDTEGSFIRAIGNVRGNSILLIEDIDSYFKGRQSETKISFSTFINAISGVDSIDNVILVVTTNNPELLDEAILRSGRIDLMIEIPYPNGKEINEYLSFFYGQPITMIITAPKVSIADIENICCQHKDDSHSAIVAITEKYAPEHEVHRDRAVLTPVTQQA